MQTQETSPQNASAVIQLQQEVIQQIETLPANLLQEVLDFLLFIKARHHQNSPTIAELKIKAMSDEDLEITRLSEPSLAEDWLTPEEDQAWQHL
ncbi:hypothetical protein RIF25_03970 [Thermosynechococcaceae cyanobacterium BACA0444]|uniref:DUF2281 domain-containing protein n=1 Tax=Pseudocalidococcus azoricus BACA0444 TaxID=2918990 RepID=A0AAE4FS02_9CYAN|nr:hypothetical protein [Pseudocalidococcus azoricus]MDS3859960.1 hypothetical protein [Pseudocalidococcus azoricus BACA0444]